MTPPTLNFTFLAAGEDRYLFLYDDAHIPDCLRTIDRFATSRELSLTREQAAILRRRIYEATGMSIASRMAESVRRVARHAVWFVFGGKG